MNLLDEIIYLPSSVSAYGWVPFVAAIILSLLFSFLYVRHFWCKSATERCSAVVTTIGIAIAILSASLLPVDVFLVSFMKNTDGSFKDWATNATRQALENSMTYTYYSFYGIIFFYTFFILPLSYFCYEERDEDRSSTVLPTALLYTVIFVLVVSGLLLAGVFIPFKSAPSTKNTTEWEKIEFLVKELYYNRGKDALAFVVNILTIYGMLNLILYTSVGLASLPLTMIKGFRSLTQEETILSNSQASNQSQINTLKTKQSQRSLSSREIAALADLEEEESLIYKRSFLLESKRHKFCYKCEPCFRIFNCIFGLLGLVFSFLLFITLLLSNIDKLTNSLGYKMGYVLKENMLPNPLDYIMLKAQTVFPLDYIIYFSIVIFLLICTVSGMRYLGICCLCIPMYKVRPGRTPPQALIMLSFLLMFVVMGFNVLMYALIPTYTTFGSQYYCETANTNVVNSTCHVKPCTLDASPDDCVMTRSAAFLLSFAYKAWIFAATYFWLTWLFLAAFVMSFIAILIRSRKSLLEEAIDKDDFDDSDEQMVRI